ncbi:MAG: hypothetical protein L3J14_02765 [Flavobacteriaceae bacterium]|nr:hypothetical protein [Flavobacteriaceae bacterium]
MKLQKLFFTMFSLCVFITTAQNLHDDANAAFPSNLLINDTNATTGWASGGTISSIIPSPLNNGEYALELISTALTDNERVIEYTFDATVSEVYNISIWVKEGDANNTGDNRPEFSNWSDLTGFSTTIITTGTVWTEYTFSVTATSTTPIIRVYAHTNLGIIGDSVQIDNVSITSSTADTTHPSTITDLSSASIDETTLTLNWTVATDNVAVTDYGVFKDGILESLTSANTYNVTGLTLGNSYDFTVYSIDAANNLSLVSNILNETTVDTTEPATITDLSSANVAETSLDLNWTTSVDNVAVTDYEVFQDAVSLGLTGGAITFNVTGLTLGSSYDFTVFVQDAAGNTSLVSNTLNETTVDTTAPNAITDLSSANVAETSLDLNWTVATDNVAVTNYEVFQDAVSLGLTGGAITFNVIGLIPSTAYDFTVFAQDAAGNTSLVSNTLNETTTVDTTAPNAPANLISSNITPFTVDLSWTASTSPDVVGYRIYQDEVLIGSTTGDIVYTVEDLEELTSYDFYVTAIDGANNESTESNTETVNTLKENTEVHYTNFNSNLISIDWTTKDLFALGNVGIGTQPDPNYKLAINGNVIAEEVRVALKANWPDYVFKKDYKLSTLSEVEDYINNYGHLENIPSAEETKKNGISVGDMNSKLLRKIEELTLYIIQQEKNINKLNDENKELKSLSNRLLEVEIILKKLDK